MSYELLEQVILPALRGANGVPAENAAAPGISEDAAVLDLSGRLAFTTDSFVVSPLFFPGGDIGDLAVNGTVNDLAVMGATPKYLSLSLIIEEGLPIAELQSILRSVARCAEAAGITVVTGDTKVVEGGKADGLYINTTGIGQIPEGCQLSAGDLRPGDRILVSGPVGDHGTAVISRREGLSFETAVVSDTAPVHRLTKALLDCEAHIRAMRDPTRGGLATTVKEWALSSMVGILLHEEAIPVSNATLRACELLGLDPLYVACEGRIIVAVDPSGSDAALQAMRSWPEGAGAALIGEVQSPAHSSKLPGESPALPGGMPLPGELILRTRIGGGRNLDMLPGEQLPRIC